MLDTRNYSDAGTLAAAAATHPRTVAAVVALSDRAQCWHRDRYNIAIGDAYGDDAWTAARREPGETGDAQALNVHGASIFDGPMHGPERAA